MIYSPGLSNDNDNAFLQRTAVIEERIQYVWFYNGLRSTNSFVNRINLPGENTLSNLSRLFSLKVQ